VWEKRRQIVWKLTLLCWPKPIGHVRSSGTKIMSTRSRNSKMPSYERVTYATVTGSTHRDDNSSESL